TQIKKLQRSNLNNLVIHPIIVAQSTPVQPVEKVQVHNHLLLLRLLKLMELRKVVILQKHQRITQRVRTLKLIAHPLMRNQPAPQQQQHFLLKLQTTTRRVMQTAAAVSAVLCGCVYHY
ncbi:uncharacterized protein TM35_000581000, partial [Trypanosoma theileri]